MHLAVRLGRRERRRIKDYTNQPEPAQSELSELTYIKTSRLFLFESQSKQQHMQLIHIAHDSSVSIRFDT